jgi:hypothetical protein
MLRLCTEFYKKKRVHSQCLDDVAILKISSVGDGHLQASVRFASGGMDAIDRHEVLRGPSDRISPVILRFRVSCSTAEIMESLYGNKESNFRVLTYIL